MKLEEVNSIDQIEKYLEGCINDFEGGIMDKRETIDQIGGLIVHVYKMALKTNETKTEKK